MRDKGYYFKQIRDNRLWEYPDSPYASFSDYLRQQWDYSEGYVSTIINSADEALRAKVELGIDLPNELVARRARKLPDDIRDGVLLHAAVLSGDNAITSAHIHLAHLQSKAEQIKGDLKQVADFYDWWQSPYHIEWLLKQYHERKKENSLFEALAETRLYIDPADGNSSVHIPSASVHELGILEKRWYQTVSLINPEKPITLEGVFDTDVLLNGQRIPAGRRVRITFLD